MWGIHNDSLTYELIDEGFVSIAWDEIGDLRAVGPTRDDLKAVLATAYPDRKPGAIPVWAGTIARFRDEIRPGDVIVAPFRPDSTINIGIVTGEYFFVPDADTHRHRRKVEWKKTGLARTTFSQSALYEIGSVLTVFGIKRHNREFAAALQAPNGNQDEITATVEAVVAVEDGVADEPRADRVHRQTKDFILDQLTRSLNHREFEEFTAAVLRAIGYQARVTQYSGDGGVDVIAHRDPLGIEPPLIKVQCKHRTATIGSPEVGQLIGTLAADELGLFVTLGTYSRDALSTERQRRGLRLINGEELVDLVLTNYERLEPAWRARIPLRAVYVVDETVGQ
ncbi:restriction endonuclease [Curtobacterium sp. MCBD17_019]|uniref:restriction endonuclease n=1 Tax=Curtobacterium sp. MCBD17_019 TaxID=2175669 RepID=UPI000DA8B7D2|nr:restriction endonuclease [Curtobacterium sp. MCBD17_019]PZE76583.1 restriction endonuclease [Curtobacterium sp. MCBD17_019]